MSPLTPRLWNKATPRPRLCSTCISHHPDSVTAGNAAGPADTHLPSGTQPSHTLEQRHRSSTRGLAPPGHMHEEGAHLQMDPWPHTPRLKPPTSQAAVSGLLDSHGLTPALRSLYSSNLHLAAGHPHICIPSYPHTWAPSHLRVFSQHPDILTPACPLTYTSLPHTSHCHIPGQQHLLIHLDILTPYTLVHQPIYPHLAPLTHTLRLHAHLSLHIDTRAWAPTYLVLAHLQIHTPPLTPRHPGNSRSL